MAMRGTRAKREEDARQRRDAAAQRRKEKERLALKATLRPLLFTYGDPTMRMGPDRKWQVGDSSSVAWKMADDQKERPGASSIRLSRTSQTLGPEGAWNAEFVDLVDDPVVLLLLWRRLDAWKPGRWVIPGLVDAGGGRREDCVLRIHRDQGLHLFSRETSATIADVPAHYARPWKVSFDQCMQFLLRAIAVEA